MSNTVENIFEIVNVHHGDKSSNFEKTRRSSFYSNYIDEPISYNNYEKKRKQEQS